MKKNLLMMAAVMFGILIAFASCKDNKKSNKDTDDEEDETEQVEGKKGKSSQKSAALKKVASLEDIETLTDYDLDDIDISELKMDDIDLDNIDLDNLTESQANALLDLVVVLGKNELPQDAGEGVTMTSIEKDDDDVTFVLEMDPSALQGVSIKQLDEVLNMPELREMMMQEMMKNLEGDEDVNTLMQVVLAANKNLVIRFADKNSNDTANLRLNASELRRIQQNQ